MCTDLSPQSMLDVGEQNVSSKSVLFLFSRLLTEFLSSLSLFIKTSNASLLFKKLEITLRILFQECI